MRQDQNKERRVLASHGAQPAENTKCTAPEDKQDASGYTIRLLGCTPSTGSVMLRQWTVCSQTKQRLPYAIQPQRSQCKPKAHVPRFMTPLGGWTHNNIVPSVIKVSAQGSRVLHSRGTPAHTRDDIRDRNRIGGRKEETGMRLLGLKRESTVTDRWIDVNIKKLETQH